MPSDGGGARVASNSQLLADTELRDDLQLPLPMRNQTSPRPNRRTDHVHAPTGHVASSASASFDGQPRIDLVDVANSIIEK